MSAFHPKLPRQFSTHCGNESRRCTRATKQLVGFNSVFRALLTMVAASSGTPPVPIDMVSWFSPDDYPAEAMIAGEQGTVEFEVNVDPRGRPVACRVTDTSRHPSLDRTTCSIVMTKGHFRAAIGADGQPTSGTYKSKASWRAPGSGGPSYQATIIDFTGPQRKPSCSMQTSEGYQTDPMSCTNLLQRTDFLEELRQRYKRVVFVTSSSPAGALSSPPPLEWGEKLGRLANYQYYSKGSFPFACTPVAAEGWNTGADPCGGFPGPHSVTDAQRAISRIVLSEETVYGVER